MLLMVVSTQSRVAFGPMPEEASPRLEAGAPKTQAEAGSGRLQVHVVDSFDGNWFALQRASTRASVSHGDMVMKIIESGLGKRADVHAVPMDPGGQEGRLTSNPVETVVRLIGRISREEGALQGVPPSKANLRHHAINLSNLVDLSTPQRRQDLQRAVAQFTAQGGRIYASAGNGERNDTQDVRGVTNVDGSEGLVGAKPNRTPSERYDPNGQAPNVANAAIKPEPLAAGGVDIDRDGVADVRAGELPAVPAGPWMAKSLAGVSRADADFARKFDSYVRGMYQLFYSPPPGLGTMTEEEVGRYLSDQVSEISRQFETGFKGKVLTLQTFQQVTAQHASLNERAKAMQEMLQRPGVDASQVYVDAESAAKALVAKDFENVGSVVLYERGPDGRLQHLSHGGLPKVYGTSFSSPQFLVESELGRLGQR